MTCSHCRASQKAGGGQARRGVSSTRRAAFMVAASRGPRKTRKWVGERRSPPSACGDHDNGVPALTARRRRDLADIERSSPDAEPTPRPDPAPILHTPRPSSETRSIIPARRAPPAHPCKAGDVHFHAPRHCPRDGATSRGSAPAQYLAADHIDDRHAHGDARAAALRDIELHGGDYSLVHADGVARCRSAPQRPINRRRGVSLAVEGKER